MRMWTLPALGVAVFLLGCSKQPATTPAKPTPPAAKSFVRARSIAGEYNPLSQLGLSEFVFDYQFPENTRCTLWMKTYVGGKLDRQLCHVVESSPQAGEHFAGHFLFNRYDPSVVAEKASTESKWYFGMRGWTSFWVTDPFKNTGGPAPHPFNQENLELGRTYVVGVVLGATEDGKRTRHYAPSDNEAKMAKEHAVAVLIKIRLDPQDGDAKTPQTSWTAARIPEFDESP